MTKQEIKNYIKNLFKHCPKKPKNKQCINCWFSQWNGHENFICKISNLTIVRPTIYNFCVKYIWKYDDNLENKIKEINDKTTN